MMMITKLHINTNSSNLVSRPQLLKKLNEGITKKLTLISAPAGFGKTCLLSDWINKNKLSVAWLSIDKRDKDPVRFLDYISAAIESIHNGFSNKTIKLISGPNRPDPESILALIINEIVHIDKKVILILDDFHLIDSSEIFELIKYLIYHSSSNFHLIISTRSDPPIPMSRLRSQGQLLEIRISDLSFSNNEVVLFFNKKLKLGLSQEDINILEISTEGWIAGLQLASLSLKESKSKSEFIRTFAGNNRFILDYLMEEVMDRQSPYIKDFLLKSAIFDQFSAGFCNEILEIENSNSIIEFLERNNMFIISLDNEKCWYRYHHLFHDLLKMRQNSISSSYRKGLHKKASKWFERKEMYPLAIENAVEFGDTTKALELLNIISEKLWRSGKHDLLKRFGELIPYDALSGGYEFCVFYTWVLISDSQLKKAEDCLNYVENSLLKRLSSTENGKQNNSLLGKMYIMYVYLLSSIGKIENIVDYCELANKYLPNDDAFWNSWLWYSYGVAYLSKGNIPKSIESFKMAHEFAMETENLFLIASTVTRIAYGSLRQGSFHEAYDYCSHLVKTIDEGGYSLIMQRDWSYASLYSIIAYVQFMWNDLDEALVNAQRGYELSQGGNDITLSIFNSIVYAKILRSKNDILTADKIWSNLDNLYWKKIPIYLQMTFCAWKVSLLLENDSLSEAEKLLKKYKVGPSHVKKYANELINISFARLMMKKSELVKAEKFLFEILEIAEEGKRVERTVEIKIVLAILYKMIGNIDRAVYFLEKAIIEAEKENLLMFFVLDNPEILDLIELVYSQNTVKQTNVPIEFLKKIRDAIETTKIYNVSQDILSTREMDVLKLIYQQKSNQEIADKLYVSKNTVKTHAKNIYIKLEVPNRHKAVAKAKELGIF